MVTRGVSTSLFLYNKLDICQHIPLLYDNFCQVLALLYSSLFGITYIFYFNNSMVAWLLRL